MDMSVCPVVDEGPYLKLQVQLPKDAATRAVPKGGETGDGTEDGIRHENELKNVMVFIIRNGYNFDSPSATPFVFKGYVDDSDPTKWTATAYGVDVTFPVGTYIPQHGDRVIVVANAGNLLGLYNNLGELRDGTSYLPWRNGSSLAANDLFVMTSAYNNGEGSVNVLLHHGTEADPFLSELHIQRAAARIDFMYKETANFSGTAPTTELFYTVKNSTGTQDLATVHLQNIIPFNLMQQPSYLIKRVATTITSPLTVNHGAMEETTGSPLYQPTNYVVEPHTLLKQSVVSDATLNAWYGSTRAQTVFSNPTPYLSTTGISNYVATHTPKAELGYFTHYMTLAYTNENTQSKEKHSPDFMTGLLLKTIYEPKVVYADKDKTPYSPMSAYATGRTFWRYSPTKGGMKEEDCLYFENEMAATGYQAEHPTDLAVIEKFPDGVCYYNIWLRHANVDSDPHVTFPMEYGIVRNNIYRVGVETITGPGSATPSLEAPEHAHLRIFVRPWNLREQPVIRL